MLHLLRAASELVLAAMRAVMVDEISSDEEGNVYTKQVSLFDLFTRKILQAIITAVSWGLGASPLREDAKTREVILRLNLAANGI